MGNIKTAISLKKSLFEQVNRVAEELEIPRSRVFAMAVQEFIKHHQNQKLLEAINGAYEDLPDLEEIGLRDKARNKYRKMVEGEW
jgi:metal-responsive CopG/Arc/MetJ family transcriptional regulator